MSELNRRGFFHRTALGTLGAAAGLGVASAISLASLRPASAQTPAKRVGGPKLKLSLNAYCFAKLLNDNLLGRGKGLTLLDLLDFCAQHDFEAIDPTGYYFPGYGSVRLGPKGKPTDAYIRDFKRRAFELGVAISGTGVANDLATPDKEKRAADVKHIKDWVEVAAKLVRRCSASSPVRFPRAMRTNGMKWPSGWWRT